MNILKIFGLVLLACGAYLFFDHWVLPWIMTHQPQHIASPAEETSVRFTRPIKVESAPAAHSFNPTPPDNRCDGRTHCSQMTSCAEANFFLAHCSNTEMDGDHDGVPCERQWCEPPPR
ncbi:MAG TPA: excalibur calcium-binding domain-containing protein [Methylophilus sp.]|nr:excalibur calcium-binding domain-containing protein [Methylophilus sp.]